MYKLPHSKQSGGLYFRVQYNSRSLLEQQNNYCLFKEDRKAERVSYFDVCLLVDSGSRTRAVTIADRDASVHGYFRPRNLLVRICSNTLFNLELCCQTGIRNCMLCVFHTRSQSISD
jgi:hypothetical protein